MAKIAILDGVSAYYVDISGATNVLSTGSRYLKEDEPIILTGFDSDVHTLAVKTSAADLKIYAAAYAVGGFAVWPVYSQAEGAPELLDGYLTILHTDGMLASVSATGVLGAVESDDAETMAAILTYAAAHVADYADSDEVETVIAGVKDKIRVDIAE